VESNAIPSQLKREVIEKCMVKTLVSR
jgi:hypothetical protein